MENIKLNMEHLEAALMDEISVAAAAVAAEAPSMLEKLDSSMAQLRAKGSEWEFALGTVRAELASMESVRKEVDAGQQRTQDKRSLPPLVRANVETH